MTDKNNFAHNVIGDNTPENVEHLKAKGYRLIASISDSNSRYLRANEYRVYWFTDGEGLLLRPKINMGIIIDCRGNSPMFKKKTEERIEE